MTKMYLVVVPHGWARDTDLRAALRKAKRHGMFDGTNPPCDVFVTDDPTVELNNFGQVLIDDGYEVRRVYEGPANGAVEAVLDS